MKYKELAELYSRLEKTSKRLEKTYLISEFLKNIKTDSKQELSMYLLLIRGKIFSATNKTQLGISNKLVIKAISKCMGASTKEINNEWKKLGDLGLVAAHLVNFRKQSTLYSSELSVKKVFSNLRKIATIEGTGSVETKIQLLAELLSSSDPMSAKYITRTTLEDLRIGVASSSLRDAIAWTYLDIKENYDVENKSINPESREKYSELIDLVQSGIDKLNDFAEVAKIAKEKGVDGLKEIKIKVGQPIKVMLAQKVADIESGFSKVGNPCQIEYKYDGFRMQVHKANGKIKLFTRRLEEVTKQFPDVVEFVKEFVDGDDFILDSEAVGYDSKTKKYLPFQSISQRIRRKYDIENIAKQFPVELNIFDVICFNNKEFINKAFSERREFLESVIEEKKQKIVLSRSIKVDSVDLATQFFEESLSAGNEGIMMKKLDSVYQPGSRVGTMIKVKPVMESLDLVITGAEWGNGKRSGWLTSFELSCRDSETGEFLDIGKVGTGIKELKDDLGSVTFAELTKILKPYIIDDSGKNIKISPNIVVEVEYEEIQKSNNYSSGFALRFPRVKNIRYDRVAEDCSSTYYVEQLFYNQNKRS
jgi:DNA ligase-1